MAQFQSILTLHSQGWSGRRIAGELHIDRETVSRWVCLARQASSATAGSSKPANAPFVCPGSESLDSDLAPLGDGGSNGPSGSNSFRAKQPPPRSCTLSGVMTNPQTTPNASTTTCRLRPTTFFRVVAEWPLLFGRLHALAVEHRGGRFELSPRLPPRTMAQLRVNPLPSAILLQEAQIMRHDTAGW